MGFALLDADGLPVAAIHVAGTLADWMPDEFVKRVAPLGLQAARSLSKY